MAKSVERAGEGDAPRRKNDPAGVRSRILDAAFNLFQTRGYGATSVLEIASASKVTGGALHHHFPTKKALGLAVIDERVGQALEETWLEPVRAAPTAAEGILGVFDSLARELDQQGSVRGCPVNNLTLELAFVDADFRKALSSLFEGWRSALAGKLRSHEDAASLATMIVASYSGAMALAKVEQRGEPLRMCARELRPLLAGRG
jgi:AcrR family transcriptional regulator